MDFVYTPEKPTLPAPAVALCFNKDDFLRDNFDVDSFISSCRKKVPLEQMRDDMGYYLKVLQNAMIELINKDYADFVNLSSNLVGLDKSIEDLQSPLRRTQQDVETLKSVIEEEIAIVEAKLRNKEMIHKKKEVLEQLISVSELVEEMGKLLESQRETDEEVDSQMLERVAGQFNSLQYNYNKCSGLPLCEQLKPQIIHITSTLQDQLERQFLQALAEKDDDKLCQTLRSYASMDKIEDLENLYQVNVVSDYMNEHINDSSCNTLDGLIMMFDNVKKFLPKNFNILKEITVGAEVGGMSSGRSAVSEPIRGFDFMARVIIPTILSTILSRSSNLFDAGNPDLFIKRYHLTMSLLTQLEHECSSQNSVMNLHSMQIYTKFMAKWSLPVYFQIRFYHIGSVLERALDAGFVRFSDPGGGASGSNRYQLELVVSLWRCLYRCWSEEVYIQQLAGKFYKLTLQILSRYNNWLGHILTDAPGSQVSVDDMLALIHDTMAIIKHAPAFYTHVVESKITAAKFDNRSELFESFESVVGEIGDHIPVMSSRLTQGLVDKCSPFVKQCNDIPRLYRRTNRDPPQGASPYVAAIFDTLGESRTSRVCELIEAGVLNQWFVEVLNSVTDSYYNLLSELLVSVRRMEESLRKLKKARSGASLSSMSTSSSGAAAAAAASVSTWSDDDKIREQIYLDVEAYGMRASELINRPAATLTNYTPLWDMVLAARPNTGS